MRQPWENPDGSNTLDGENPNVYVPLGPPADEGIGEDESALKAGEWNEADHPRHPAGSSAGGEFAPSRDAVDESRYVEVAGKRFVYPPESDEEITVVQRLMAEANDKLRATLTVADESIRPDAERTISDITGNLTTPALLRLAENARLFHVYDTTASLNEQYVQHRGHAIDYKVGGYWSWSKEGDDETGALHVSIDHKAAWSHEMAHAIDGHWTLSRMDEWQEAWREEIASGKLSDYAKTNPTEGFAELFRHAMTNGYRWIREDFPKSWAFMRKHRMM